MSYNNEAVRALAYGSSQFSLCLHDQGSILASGDGAACCILPVRLRVKSTAGETEMTPQVHKELLFGQ